MARPTPLHEFMPYGAPDLIDARPRHMSRALALASTAAIVLLGVGMAVGTFVQSRTAVVEIVNLPPSARDVLPPPPLVERAPPPPPAAARAPVAPAPPRVAVPVPVPDRVAPVEPPAAAPAGDPQASEGPISLPTPPGGAGDAIPDPNAYVYVEQLPAPVRQVKPEYPEIARATSVEGVVQVRVLVGKDGKVMDARLERSTAEMLNAAALAAARKWIFTPGMANQEPVLCWVSIPFNFQLN